jgi:hypothetical protein
MKPGACRLWELNATCIFQLVVQSHHGLSLRKPSVQRYKLNLKANFETSFSLDRLEGWLKPSVFKLRVNWIQRVHSPTSAVLSVRDQNARHGGGGSRRSRIRALPSKPNRVAAAVALQVEFEGKSKI